MVKENNKENNNDSTYLYIIAIVAIVAIVAMVMMMSTPRGAPVNSGTMLSDDDLAGQAVAKTKTTSFTSCGGNEYGGCTSNNDCNTGCTCWSSGVCAKPAASS
jgi:hypothetical protein